MKMSGKVLESEVERGSRCIEGRSTTQVIAPRFAAIEDADTFEYKKEGRITMALSILREVDQTEDVHGTALHISVIYVAPASVLPERFTPCRWLPRSDLRAAGAAARWRLGAGACRATPASPGYAGQVLHLRAAGERV